MDRMKKLRPAGGRAEATQEATSRVAQHRADESSTQPKRVFLYPDVTMWRGVLPGDRRALKR